MPDGGDQVPSGVLATRTPDPPAPETHRPVRIVVKMARPFAFLITCGLSAWIDLGVERWGNARLAEYASRPSAWPLGRLLARQASLRGRSHPLDERVSECEGQGACLGGGHTAEAAQDACCLVALLVEGGGPKGFGAEPVAEFVHRGAQFVDEIPGLVEADLSSAAHSRPPAALLRRHGPGHINPEGCGGMVR